LIGRDLLLEKMEKKRLILAFSPVKEFFYAAEKKMTFIKKERMRMNRTTNRFDNSQFE